MSREIADIIKNKPNVDDSATNIYSYALALLCYSEKLESLLEERNK